MPYLPIADHGIIGNLHTAALVGKNGAIDWFCFPHFDSPSVFAAILDDRRGGRFAIAPLLEEESAEKQLYWPDTNVLITRFLSADGVGEITDYMPIGTSGADGRCHRLVRRVSAVRGTMPFRLECRPAFNYARDGHTVSLTGAGARFDSPRLSLALHATAPLQQVRGGVEASFRLAEGETAVFVLQDADAAPARPLSEPESSDLFRETVRYWRTWLSRCTYHGRWREIVHRSALLLKLLTFAPTGAIVAAPTCSLPETLGGVRNWDYRYTWIRDAAFTLYGLLRIGFTEEAEHFMHWLDARCHEGGEACTLQAIYGIDGRTALPEQVLGHLEGYRGSRPVRIGNAAYNQLQLDIYGELMDSVYLYNKYASPISDDLWRHLRPMVQWVADHWHEPDEGIWEVRGGRRQFVYSNLMCWVALDRALRLADKRSFPADRARWLAARDRIYEAIMTRGWSPRRQSFAQAFDSDTLDAAALMMPMVFFLAPSDPRMLKTLDAIHRSPARGGLVSDGLVYRYDVDKTPDGLRGEEGTFNMCTFWLVEALTRAGRVDRARLDQARLLFEHMLGYANHLGLYAEETGPRGEALGNFPQGFTHLALISAAFNLDRTLGRQD